MRLVDSHAHFHEEAFEGDHAETLARARAAGVVGVLSLGTDVQSSRRVVELAHKYESIFAAVGVHPTYCADFTDADWEQIVKLASDERVFAIGETGLDLYWKTVPLDIQVGWFRKQIELSRQLNKPFSVHCREADEAVLSELKRAAIDGPLRGVMHSFASSLPMAEACLELGMDISFSGIVTYKKSALLREVAQRIPEDRILVETDSPYLAPQPVRGKRNEPAYVRMTAEVVAEVRGMTLDEFSEISTRNAQRLFQFPLPTDS